MKKVLLTLLVSAAMVMSSIATFAGESDGTPGESEAADQVAAESEGVESHGESADGESPEGESAGESGGSEGGESAVVYADEIDNSIWKYDPAVNCYYQIGIQYCENPESTDYETLAIYVPGEYMIGTENEDGTFTCVPNPDGTVNGFNAETAPVVIPVNTPGYMASKSQTSYDYNKAKSYVNAGFIYVNAGCRGRNNEYDEDGNLLFSAGAPWGVTDLKAAIRFLRFYENELVGDQNTVFTFGMSGGGAQSSLVGASGDSDLYIPYLESIGAYMTDTEGNPLSDAITGAMCWCPITSLGISDETYEWNMGQFMDAGNRTDGSFKNVLSDDLAKVFPAYLNELGLTDENGNALTLEESEEGIWVSGSYYDYLMNVINTSLNNYLADNDLGNDYVAGLNEEAGAEWITMDENGVASVSDMGSFVINWKPATKDVGAFDDFSGIQPENRLFGNDMEDAVHFDSIMAALLADKAETYSEYEDWNPEYVQAYAEGVASTDKFGTDIATRLNAYEPLYYVNASQEGFGTSGVAPFWRINTGLKQGDTALTTEVNLALSLAQMDGVSVEFTTVWDKPHVEAERTGDYTDNFIDWVFACLENDVERVIRESGAGDPTPVDVLDPLAVPANGFEMPEGYELCEHIDFYFEGVDQTVDILASINENKDLMNLQFLFFGDKQDVTLELQNGEWVVIADASGFMSMDGPVIANAAMEADQWDVPGSDLSSPYERAEGYELYEVFEFNFENAGQIVTVLASSNTVQTKMNLQFDFFGDKQDVTLELQNGEWVVTADATGFLSMDGPVIAQTAVEIGGWIY